MMKNRRVHAAIPYLLGLLFAVYGVGVIWQQSFHAIDGQRYYSFADDGLISLRYGWNLAHGMGFVWNPGERVEGITNTLWALQAAAVSCVLDKRLVPLAMQLSAIGWLLLAACCFRWIARSCLTDRAGGPFHDAVLGVAFLLPLSYSPLLFWSLRGMETGLHAALLAAAVLLFLRTPHKAAPAGSLLLGLAWLTRPDTVVASCVIFAVRTLGNIRKERGWNQLALELAPFLTIVIAMTGFRLFYYGSPVPNTYALKLSGLSVLEHLSLNGLDYILPFLWMVLPLAITLCISLVLRPSREKLLFVSLPVAMLAYTMLIGGDAFGNWRLLAPYVPFAFLALLLDFHALERFLRKSFNGSAGLAARRHLAMALAGVFLLTVARPPFFTGYIKELRDPLQDDIDNVNTAIWLDRILEPSATVGVFFAGSIPFYTGRGAVDFLGKSDRHIAALPPDMSGAVSWRGLYNIPGHNKYDLRYSILLRQPTYVQGLKWGVQDITDAALRMYTPVPVDYSTCSLYDRHSVLLRKDSPLVRWDRIQGHGSAEGR